MNTTFVVVLRPIRLIGAYRGLSGLIEAYRSNPVVLLGISLLIPEMSANTLSPNSSILILYSPYYKSYWSCVHKVLFDRKRGRKSIGLFQSNWLIGTFVLRSNRTLSEVIECHKKLSKSI